MVLALDAGRGVAERYFECRRGHGIAAEEHAPTIVSTVMACGAAPPWPQPGGLQPAA
jgi:hypothetical protein